MTLDMYYTAFMFIGLASRPYMALLQPSGFLLEYNEVDSDVHTR